MGCDLGQGASLAATCGFEDVSQVDRSISAC